ncbi:MAG: S8 family peptidase [Candidatus Marinimicrobia bacterium]|nr:S8 family peptidase [Candidatus Neomarinimicrobiota bacterium]
MHGILYFFLLIFSASSLNASQLPPKRTPQYPVINPNLEQVGIRSGGLIHAWIYFTDKGIHHPEEYAAVLRKIKGQLTEKNLLRRQKLSKSDIVSFRDIPVHQEYVSRILSTGVSLRHRSRWLNAVSVAATRSQLEVVSQFSFVAKIDPVRVHKRPIPEATPDEISSILIPPSTISKTQYDTLDYGSSLEQIQQINIHLAHEAGYTGEGVVVLMLDTGYFKDHESIQQENIIAEWDFINNDGNTQNEVGDPSSQHDHGTYTLSALGGYAPGNLIGPAFDSHFLLAKTEIVDQEIQQEEDNYVAALEWGDSLGADVVSSSLGYIDWYTYPDMDGNTAVTTKAMDIAASVGIVCVTAAGNEGDDDWYYIIAPADADSVISVGAVDMNGVIAGFSSHGPTYDGRLKPEVCARGVSTVCASPFNVDQYTRKGGTSLSTPLVAGAAAVILSAHPDWTPMMVREALMKTASRADYPDNSYGWGVIDVWEAIRFDSFSEGPEPPLPEKFSLSQIYPNPFNPFNQVTTIKYELPNISRVKIKIFSLLGEEIATIVDDVEEAGEYDVRWSARGTPSGIYFVQLRILWYIDPHDSGTEGTISQRRESNFTQTRKVVLIK